MKMRVLVTLLVVAVAACTVQADPVALTLNPADFGDLLGSSATAAGDAVVENLTGPYMYGSVTSQAFTDGQGNYAYLYQVENTGQPGDHSITRLTCQAPAGFSENTQVGYLTGSAPAGFTIGEQEALGADVMLDSEAVLGFSFPAPIAGVIPESYVINPGETSVTLYALSDVAPGLGTANVIDGAVASTNVVVPVPEPATIAVLSLGAVALLRKRKHA